MSRRTTRRPTARDRGSSAVEFALMVAAMAAMIVAVVLGVGHVVGDVFFHGCNELSSQLAAGGTCVAPDAPAAGAGEDGKISEAPALPADQGSQGADPQGQGAGGGRPAPGANDLGSNSDDM